MRLATCDHAGRFADNQDKIDYELFQPKEKMAIIEDLEGYKNKTVTLMVGLPYSGKSTEVDITIPREYPWDHFIISRDKIIQRLIGKNYNEKWNNADQKEVDKELQIQFKESKKYTNVIVDMTHMSAKSRRKTLSHFGENWQKNCIVMLPTLQTIEERQKLRTDKVIDNSVIDAMIKSFRPPCLGEGFDNIEYRF
jgi:predicted kinase